MTASLRLVIIDDLHYYSLTIVDNVHYIIMTSLKKMLRVVLKAGARSDLGAVDCSILVRAYASLGEKGTSVVLVVGLVDSA